LQSLDDLAEHSVVLSLQRQIEPLHPIGETAAAQRVIQFVHCAASYAVAVRDLTEVVVRRGKRQENLEPVGSAEPIQTAFSFAQEPLHVLVLLGPRPGFQLDGAQFSPVAYRGASSGEDLLDLL